MSGYLAQAQEAAERSENTASLVIERDDDGKEQVAQVARRTLAVARSNGTLVLARERTVGKVGKDGKRSKENGTEPVFKRTAEIADFGFAVQAGLL